MRENPRRIEPLQVFSPDQLEELHQASLEVLRRTGVQVDLPAAVEKCPTNSFVVRNESVIEIKPANVTADSEK